jgi:hypothetical protein
MVLREDETQFLIYQPDRVAAAFEAMNAASLVMFGAYLQRIAPQYPAAISDNLGHIGVVLSEIGFARTQINAGTAPNDIPDVLVRAQRLWDDFVKWQHDPHSQSVEAAAAAVEQLDGALSYLHERTMETGTNHPRWNSRIVSGQPCEACGRV